ncbi:PadR family transcriptional regulator [Nevskia sp.]|uniref:PadR family transcriptional regulator n=1 Tax=Nevskia sp. TaxID=1929292 RepID=UPI0025E95919|nr:PadR family transcriptional regulator [Nevskia sp.]
MALSHAILVSLLDRSHSGYDLAKRFDQTVGFFWPVSHQQIYQELHKLARAGWVRGETIEQADRPNRIVYELTSEGRQALDAWLTEPTSPPSFKEELLVKLFALEGANRDTLVMELGRRRALHIERLARYESIMAEHYPDPTVLNARKRGRYLGLRMGILTERTTIAWCDEAIACVGAA